MNVQQHFIAAAAASTLVGILSAAPAQAFKFGTSGISFNKDTTVDFSFNQSNGLFRSELKVLEVLDNGQFLEITDLFKETQAHDEGNEFTGNNVGTCPTTIPNCSASFTFKAGKEYTLGLYGYNSTSGNLKTTVFSTTLLGSQTTQQALFGSWGTTGADGSTFSNASQYQEANPFESWVKIGFDDRGNQNDRDFQDFTIEARAEVSVPEPATLAGLGLIAGGLAFSRRRKSSQFF